MRILPPLGPLLPQPELGGSPALGPWPKKDTRGPLNPLFLPTAHSLDQ